METNKLIRAVDANGEPGIQIGQPYIMHNTFGSKTGLKPLESDLHVFIENGDIITLIKIDGPRINLSKGICGYTFYFIYLDCVYTTSWCALDEHFCFYELPKD